MAEFAVPLRKGIEHSLTRQGMQNVRGLHRKGLAEREKNQQMLLSERAHKQVLTVKKNIYIILHSSTRALVTVSITTASDGGFHRESMCTQT